MLNKPRGTNDIFDQTGRVHQYINDIFTNLLTTYNYQPIETPIFEVKELFVRGVGNTSDIVSKEMYEFKDRKDRSFVLRPEGTSGVVRALIENKMYVQNNLPVKVYYSGPMFRYERPQAGRSRQFTQLGIESFGIDSLAQDLEIIVLAMEFLSALGLSNQATIYLNYLVGGENREKYITDLKTFLKTIPDLDEDCQKRIETNPLRILDCKVDGPKLVNGPNMEDYLTDAERQRIDTLTNFLNALDYKVVLERQLVRGLDYYTGFVFEIKYESDAAIKDLTLIGGGRYDNLVEQLGGPSLPAAGFGIGLERIASILEQNPSLIPELDSGINVYVGILGNFTPEKWEFVNSLRILGIKVEANLQEMNLKQIFKAGEKYAAKKVIILGDDEIKNQEVKIKDQQTGSEVSAKLGAIKLEDLI